MLNDEQILLKTLKLLENIDISEKKPEKLLAEFGMDITKPGFWQNGFDYIQDKVKELLKVTLDYLEKDARIIFITFHSIEDKIIKSFFKNNSIDCICPKEIPICQCDIKPKIEIITKKALTPSKFSSLLIPSATST